MIRFKFERDIRAMKLKYHIEHNTLFTKRIVNELNHINLFGFTSIDWARQQEATTPQFFVREYLGNLYVHDIS